MKTKERDDSPSTPRVEAPKAAPQKLTVRTGARAGRLGNKIWNDDWLAPV